MHRHSHMLTPAVRLLSRGNTRKRLGGRATRELASLASSTRARWSREPAQPIARLGTVAETLVQLNGTSRTSRPTSLRRRCIRLWETFTIGQGFQSIRSCTTLAGVEPPGNSTYEYRSELIYWHICQSISRPPRSWVPLIPLSREGWIRTTCTMPSSVWMCRRESCSTIPRRVYLISGPSLREGG